MAYKAVIAGASGLVGGHLVDMLLHDDAYDEVLILVRKELAIKHRKLVQLVLSFDDLENFAASINGHAVFSCLGTTRKQTPDLATYRKIDHDYAIQLAKIAKDNGVRQFHLVSAIGANSASGNFYLKIKGETEDDIKNVGLKCLHIYQPSLIVGNRGNKTRGMEVFLAKLFQLVNPLLVGSLKKYRSINARQIAYAMFSNSLKKEDGVYVHTTDNIQQTQ